jgi:hypothetical protein
MGFGEKVDFTKGGLYSDFVYDYDTMKTIKA